MHLLFKHNSFYEDTEINLGNLANISTQMKTKKKTDGVI